MSYRDRDVFEDLISRLEASGEFASATFGLASDPARTAIMARPLARVLPVEWSESPDASVDAVIRTVRYALEIVVEHPDPWRRYLIVDRLSTLAQSLLINNDFGGKCLPGLSALSQARLPSSPSSPELTIVLSGTFGYRISTNSNRNYTD